MLAKLYQSLLMMDSGVNEESFDAMREYAVTQNDGEAVHLLNLADAVDGWFYLSEKVL